jgi:hypothetical protein
MRSLERFHRGKLCFRSFTRCVIPFAKPAPDGVHYGVPGGRRSCRSTTGEVGEGAQQRSETGEVGGERRYGGCGGRGRRLAPRRPPMASSSRVASMAMNAGQRRPRRATGAAGETGGGGRRRRTRWLAMEPTTTSYGSG